MNLLSRMVRPAYLAITLVAAPSFGEMPPPAKTRWTGQDFVNAARYLKEQGGDIGYLRKDTVIYKVATEQYPGDIAFCQGKALQIFYSVKKGKSVKSGMIFDCDTDGKVDKIHSNYFLPRGSRASFEVYINKHSRAGKRFLRKTRDFPVKGVDFGRPDKKQAFYERTLKEMIQLARKKP